MELLRTLAVLAEPPRSEHRSHAELLGLGALPAAAEHTALFELQLYPYASFYLGAEGMLGGEARDRIAGFWRALGETPPPEPDHLVTMLGLAARLGELEEAAEGAARDGWRRARRAWLWEHLLSWLPLFCDKAGAIGAPFYRCWAELLAAGLAEEAAAVGAQEELALHLREAPEMADPRREGGEAFVAALLAPARSGLLLTRADFEGAARELGLGCRAGERRYMLRALLGQDAGAVLSWLSRCAAEAAERYAALRPAGAWTGFWCGRAAASAELLSALAQAGPPNGPA